MAADTIVTGAKLTAIANALRGVLGTQATYTLDEIAAAIAQIQTGGDNKLPSAVLRAPDVQVYSSRYYTLSASDFGTAAEAGQCTAIANGAFSAGSSSYSGHFYLRGVEIPAWVTKIWDSAFAYLANLQTVTFLGGASAGALPICNYAFNYSGLTSLSSTRPLNLSQAAAFMSCSSLASVDVVLDPANGSLGVNAFRSCYALSSVTLHHAGSGGAVVYLNSYCLQGTDLGTLVLDVDSVATLGTNPFGTSQGIDVYVPDSLLASYQADSGWAALVTGGTVALHGMSDLPAS